MTDSVSLQHSSALPQTEVSTQSSVNHNDPSLVSHNLYSEIASRFYHASQPDFVTQLQGRHIGRCYDKSGLMNYAVALQADTRESSQDGPILGTQSKAMVAWYLNVPLTHFEQMTTEKETQLEYFENNILFADSTILPVQAIGKSLVTYEMSHGGYEIKNEFRSDGQYTYVQYHDARDNSAYCYFYKRVE